MVGLSCTKAVRHPASVVVPVVLLILGIGFFLVVGEMEVAVFVAGMALAGGASAAVTVFARVRSPVLAVVCTGFQFLLAVAGCGGGAYALSLYLEDGDMATGEMYGDLVLVLLPSILVVVLGASVLGWIWIRFRMKHGVVSAACLSTVLLLLGGQVVALVWFVRDSAVEHDAGPGVGDVESLRFHLYTVVFVEASVLAASGGLRLSKWGWVHLVRPVSYLVLYALYVGAAVYESTGVLFAACVAPLWLFGVDTVLNVMWARVLRNLDARVVASGLASFVISVAFAGFLMVLGYDVFESAHSGFEWVSFGAYVVWTGLIGHVVISFGLWSASPNTVVVFNPKTLFPLATAQSGAPSRTLAFHSHVLVALVVALGMPAVWGFAGMTQLGSESTYVFIPYLAVTGSVLSLGVMYALLVSHARQQSDSKLLTQSQRRALLHPRLGAAIDAYMAARAAFQYFRKSELASAKSRNKHLQYLRLEENVTAALLRMQLQSSKHTAELVNAIGSIVGSVGQRGRSYNGPWSPSVVSPLEWGELVR